MAKTMAMGKGGLSRCLFLIQIMVVMAVAADDAAKDRDECAEQLAGLATCLQYVQGQAKAPTPDCCSGLKQVLVTNKKCLCVIVRDRNDPQLNLNINATLALGLPSVCKASADVSKCPALLHLPPNSPEAQVFYQFARRAPASAPAATAPSEKGKTPSAKTEGSGGSSAPVKSCGGCSKERLWNGMVLILGVFSWTFTLPMLV